MNIVYNCDDNYAVHTAVSITSLFESNRYEPVIRVFVLGNQISKESKKKLEDIGAVYTVTGWMEISSGAFALGLGRKLAANEFRREVRVIELEEFEAALKLLFGNGMDAGKFTVTALARIFAPQHLPEDVERYIYLDCDTVVLRPLKELAEASLDGMPAGMCAEPTIYPEVRKYLGITGDQPYFNTGMMLVDRNVWEKEEITEKCVDFYREKQGKLPFSDQDIINYVLKGKAKPLWQGYDFFSNYHYRSYKSLVRLSPWYAAAADQAGYEAAAKDPAVVHYAGDERPWYEGNRNPYREAYERYLELSPWQGTAKTAGHEKQMRYYHWMNLVTGICPGLRDLISHYYYRRSVEAKQR